MRSAPIVTLVACLLPSAALAVAEPEDGDWTLSHDIDIEYRAQQRVLRPLSLNDLTAERVTYLDQRARFDMRFRLGKYVTFRAMTDLLDGVLFGDNGSFVKSPIRNRGSLVAAKQPNLARVDIGQLDPNGDVLDLDNYGLVLRPANAVNVRMLYAEALLPFGLIRAGRQPLTRGRNTLIHDGSRINRWGVSIQPDVADSVAFGTKLSAIADVIAGREPDRDPKRGLFAGVLYGRIVENDPQRSDGLNQFAATVYYDDTDVDLLGAHFDEIRTGVTWAHRTGEQYDTKLHTFNGWLQLTYGNLFIGAFHTQMFGATREVSEGLALLGRTTGPPVRQDLRAYGGFAEIAYALSAFDLIFEVFYASGDNTPESDGPITQFTFAEDTNVGLHLFENVLHYQTARSAARGVAAIQGVNPPTYPAADINTRGGLQNAIVLFPQVVFSPLRWLSARAGVMFAFTERDNVDQVGTILGATGASLRDDMVNFNGGAPARYWGTELDVGLTFTPVDGFMLDLEGAYLWPGAALHDENGDAVNSVYGNVRFTFFYDS